jgi:hypothetical protein
VRFFVRFDQTMSCARGGIVSLPFLKNLLVFCQ